MYHQSKISGHVYHGVYHGISLLHWLCLHHHLKVASSGIKPMTQLIGESWRGKFLNKGNDPMPKFHLTNPVFYTSPNSSTSITFQISGLVAR